MHGIGGKILYVDLTSGEVKSEKVTESMVEKYLGGDGLAVKLFTDLMDPYADPLSADNVLVMAPGLFAGLPVPTCGKTVFMSKSPLTGTIAESVMGGTIGPALKRAGYDALVIRGARQSPSMLMIRSDGVEVLDAGQYWGAFTRDTARSVEEEHGGVVVACIGPGGEKLVRYAGIDCEDRQSGRAGLGAVMGAKNLKAIAIEDSGELTVAHPGKLLNLCLEWQEKIEASGAFADDTQYGTGEFLDWINAERGAFPTNNWQKSVFEEREQIDPYYWIPRYAVKNKACFSCTKPCGKLFIVEEGEYAGTAVDGIEYETLYSLGSQCGNYDIEALARANEICDLYGIDTISAGVAIGFVMELVQRGILDVNDIGVDCRFGNPDAVPQMSKMIGRREGIGKLLGEGVMRASEEIGEGSEDYAMHVKGMEPPAYDVRAIKGMGLGFMTSPRGACHLRSGVYAMNLVGEFWKFSDVDRFSPDRKGLEVKEMEDFMTIYDSLGACKFSRGIFLLEGFGEFLEAVIGTNMDEEELMEIGERINNLKQLFNYRTGIRRKDFFLPERLTQEPIDSGVSEGAVITEQEMNQMLDEYFEARGWDSEGRPSSSKLNELRIEV